MAGMSSLPARAAAITASALCVLTSAPSATKARTSFSAQSTITEPPSAPGPTLSTAPPLVKVPATA